MAAGDVMVDDAQLPVVAPLADNGGLTQTMVPASAVVDGIPSGTTGLCDGGSTADQRGHPRPAGAACDVGSVERAAVTSVSLVTDDPGDAPDSAPGDGICATAGGGCTLRAAIDEANRTPGPDTVTLGVDATIARWGPGEDANRSGDLDIRTDLVIDGDGHAIDAGFVDRALDHHAGALTLTDVVVRRGALRGGDRAGGLVRSTSTGGLVVSTSTFVDADAGAGGTGGAIDAVGPLTIRSSTLRVAGGGGRRPPGGQRRCRVDARDRRDRRPGHGDRGQRSPGHGVDHGDVGGRGLCPTAGGERVEPGDRYLMRAGPGGDPLLGPLAANGGPTPTRLPAPGSPAINAIPVGEVGACDATTPVDQRGVTRPQGFACDRGATEDDDGSTPPGPLTFTVDRSDDVADSLPGDQVCAVAGGGCTLRAAIDEANALSGPQRVELAVDVDLSRLGGNDDANVSGDLDISSPLEIDGAGHRIDGHGIDRVLDVMSPTTMRDLVITGGRASGFGGGGGVRYRADLTIERSEIVGNQAVSNPGAGVSTGEVKAPALPTLTVTDSTFADNVSGSGAALWVGSNSPAIVERSTFSDNRGTAGSVITGSVSLRASTVAGNLGAPTVSGLVDVRGSFLSSPGGPVCGSQTIVSLGFNVADESCGFASVGDRTVSDPPSAPLADNGGPTRTRLLHSSTLGLDAIPVGTPGLCDGGAVDQRGVVRPVGPACDIGAAEGSAGAAPAEQVFVVNTSADLVDVAPGDGVCATSGGTCSLRAAVGEGNAVLGPVRIQLQTDVLLTRPGVEDANDAGDIDVTDRTRIEGADRWIDAGGLDSALYVRGATLQLVRVGVRGGNTPAGVYAREATLTIDRSTIADHAGKGVISQRSLVNVTASTVSGNGGLGIHYLDGSAGRIERSTVTDNMGTSSGVSGVMVESSAVAIRQTTIAAVTGSPLGAYSTPVDLRASILTGPGVACRKISNGTITSSGWNVAPDGTCGLTGAGDQEGVAVELAPLAANGGPTRTRLPATGSPAVDAIPPGTPGACDATTAVDQRGVARPQGSGCDVGAVEGSTVIASSLTVPDAAVAPTDDELQGGGDLVGPAGDAPDDGDPVAPGDTVVRPAPSDAAGDAGSKVPEVPAPLPVESAGGGQPVDDRPGRLGGADPAP